MSGLLIVTGASAGIGAATARSAAFNGWSRVVVHYGQDKAGAEATAAVVGDFDGDGTDETTGNCNVVLLTGITADMAEKLDDHYDNGMAGTGAATWDKVGRFQYNSGNTSGIIFLYQ